MGRPAVGADRQDRRDPFDASFREAAGLGPQLGLDPGQAAVLRGAGRDLEDRRGRRIAHPEVFVAGELDADRPAQEQGRAGRQRIGDQQLPAEPTAKRCARHADSRDREAEQLRQLGSDLERALGAGCDVERAVGVKLGHGHLRLDVALVHPVRGEAAIHHHIARCERRIDITAPIPGALGDVLGQRFVGRELFGPATDGGVLRFLRRSQRHDLALEPRPVGVGNDSPVEVHDRRQRRSLDLHEMDGIGRGPGGLGDDEGDRLPGPQDLVASERLVEAVLALGHDRQIGGGQDRDDAGTRQRGGFVDRDDPGVRWHRQDWPPMEQPSNLDVGGEACTAGHFRTTVHSGDRTADRAAHSVHVTSISSPLGCPDSGVDPGVEELDDCQREGQPNYEHKRHASHHHQIVDQDGPIQDVAEAWIAEVRFHEDRTGHDEGEGETESGHLRKERWSHEMRPEKCPRRQP